MSRPYVTVVVVAHDGARWLGETLRGLLGQSVRPDRVIGVDNGSRDGSADLLAQALGPGNVRKLPRSTSFGEAVAEVLDELPPAGENEWVWLLHDDCAPDRRALEALLHAASQDRKAAVVGPKLRDWIDRRRLLEVGVTVGLTGRRDTGLEPREFDQGQHDGIREVLSVSTAGMLIRRDVWDAAGGLDPFFPIFRDDLDLCWRVRNAGHRVLVTTNAVCWHAEAAARRRRRITVSGDHPRRLDRRNAIFVVMVNLPFRTMLWALARNVVGSFVRALLFLIGKQPANALDELVALGSILVHPLRLMRARRRRRAGRRKGFAQVRPLLTPRGAGLRRLIDMVRGFLSGDRPVESAGRHHYAAPGEPEDPDEIPEDRGAVKRFLSRPGVLLMFALTLVTLVAERSLLGGDRIGGGALVPVTGTAADLWAFYTGGEWAPPYVAVVAALSTITLGQTWTAVSVLLLGAVPLAGASAYLATRGLANLPAPVMEERVEERRRRRRAEAAPAVEERGRRRRTEEPPPASGVGGRVWIAATYALLPVATGAVAAGRLGTAVVFVLLPPAVVLGGHLLFGDRRRSRRAAWGFGLLLAVATAFVPLVYVAALVLGVAAMVVLRVWVPVAIALGVPVALLLPWLAGLVLDPGRFLLEAGLHDPDLVDPRLSPESLLALNPGGPGVPPFWVTAGLVAAGLAALLTRGRRRALAAGWAVALGGLLMALVAARVEVSGAPAWPGVPLLLSAAALLVVAGLSAGRLARLRASGGIRRAVALVVAAVAFSAPVLAAGFWVVQGVRGPLRTDVPDPLPALAGVLARDGERVLLIREQEFTVLPGRTPLIGEAELPDTSEGRARIRTAAEGLAGGRGGTDAATLAEQGVAMVAVAPPVPAELAETLDSQPSLERLSLSAGGGLWRVTEPVTPAQPPPPHFLRVPWLWVQGALVLVAAVMAAPGRREPAEETEETSQPVQVLAGAR